MNDSTIGAALTALATDQSQWSQQTFGTDEERGPVGALHHLAREAVEAAEACLVHELHDNIEHPTL